MAKKTAPKAAEVEETEDEELELDELEADVEEDEAPKKKKSSQPAVEFGVADLAAYLSEKTGKTISTRDLRTLIRKMAREDSARVKREITPGNRTRYDWPGGLKHPEVKAIVKAVTGGEMEADKQKKLEELKARKAEKAAAAPKKKAKGKKAAKVEEPEDDEDIEEIELDDDED